MIIPCFYPLGKQYIKNTEPIFHELLFTPFSVTRFAMHRIYANHINSRSMARVFCDLRSQKTPRGILPVIFLFCIPQPYSPHILCFSYQLDAPAWGRGYRFGLLRRKGDNYLGCGSPSSIPRRNPCPDRYPLPQASAIRHPSFCFHHFPQQYPPTQPSTLTSSPKHSFVN